MPVLPWGAAPGKAQTGWVACPGTLTYSSTDSTGHVFTYSTSSDLTSLVTLGNRFKLTDSVSGVGYFIVVAITSTTISLYGGNTYSATHTITNPFYSYMNAQGFLRDPSIYREVVTDQTLNGVSSPTAGVWYNVGSRALIVPVGSWVIQFKTQTGSLAGSGSSNGMAALMALPAGGTVGGSFGSSPSTLDSDLCGLGLQAPFGADLAVVFCQKVVTFTVATTLYLCAMTQLTGQTTLYLGGGAPMNTNITARSSWAGL